MKPMGKPMLVALNKVDKVKDKTLLFPALQAIDAAHPWAAIVPISAIKKSNLGPLVSAIREHLPLVRRLAWHVHGAMSTSVEIEDLVQVGLLALVDDLRGCSPSSFKRLHEGLNLKAFKTSEGFITLKAGISLVGLDAKALPTDPEQLIQHAQNLLPESYASGRVAAMRLPLP